MIKVSVIIPVYNVEKYLEKCLDSIINQTLKEIEIICIDDCSKDKSYLILKEYQKKDDRIVVFKNETNQGVSVSRNIGLKAAKGEYIGFIDSDDFIDKNYYEQLYNTAKKYDTDMCFTLNSDRIKEDYEIRTIDKYENDHFVKCDTNTTLKLYGYMKHKKEKYCGISAFGTCNRLWRNEFISKNNITFSKANMAEDYYFILECYAYKPTVSYNGNAIYYYRLNLESLSHKKISTDEMIDNFTEMFDRLFNVYYNNSKDSIIYIMDRMVAYIFENYKNSDDKENLYYGLSRNIINIVKDRVNIFPDNLILKKVYACFIEKDRKKELDKILNKYNFTRKMVPRFILNMLRSRNLFL